MAVLPVWPESSAEQVPGRVQRHVGGGVTGVRQAASAVALVEEDDPERAGVERPPVSNRAPRSRAAVHDQRRHPVRVTAGLPVHEVPVTRIQQAAVIRLDIRIPGHAEILPTVRDQPPPEHKSAPPWAYGVIKYLTM